MKYTNADLTRWLQAANAALAENDLECVATSFEGRGEIRTPRGGKVTVWTSGWAESLGPGQPVEELLEALVFADLIDCKMGKMTLKMPSAAEVSEERCGLTSGRLLSASPIFRPALRVPTTEQEIVAELRQESPLNKARRAFSSWSAKIERAGQQREPLDPIEWRRLEFQAVAEIAAALGLS